jgi:hypothetical protein
LEAGQLGDDTGKRGSRCCEEHVEPVKRGMARRLTYQIGGCPIADLFKAVLFVKRGIEITVSFSVSLDQTKYRIWQGKTLTRSTAQSLPGGCSTPLQRRQDCQRQQRCQRRPR